MGVCDEIDKIFFFSTYFIFRFTKLSFAPLKYVDLVIV